MQTDQISNVLQPSRLSAETAKMSLSQTITSTEQQVGSTSEVVKPSPFLTSTTSDDLSSAAVSSTIPGYNGRSRQTFEAMVIVIGLIGLNANILVLYALCVTEHIKKHVVNILFINQMSIDLFSCVCLVVIYSCKLANIYLDGSVGDWLCIFIFSEAFVYMGLFSSSFNLAAIAVERCIKIAYPFWHKKYVSSYIVYAAVIFVWVAAIPSALAPAVSTSLVVDGVCLALAKWESPTASFAFGIEFFVGNFGIVLIIFILCYGQILITVRKQARVLAVHHSNNPLGLASKQLNNRIQLNIVKLMVLVSGLFVACLGPIFFYNLLVTLSFPLDFESDTYYSILFMAFFNSCLNPFIYAYKYNTVKQFLVRLALCRHHQTEPQSSVFGVNSSY